MVFNASINNFSGVDTCSTVWQGRVKFVKGHQNDLEPTPNYDCHVMKVAGIETAPASLFENSQVFQFVTNCINYKTSILSLTLLIEIDVHEKMDC